MARHLPWQDCQPNSSTSGDVSSQGHPKGTWRGTTQPCGARWQAELTETPSWQPEARLTVASLHCWGDRTGIKCPCPLPPELGRGHCWSLLHQPAFLPFYPLFLRCHLLVPPLDYKREAHAHVEGVRFGSLRFGSVGFRVHLRTQDQGPVQHIHITPPCARIRARSNNNTRQQ